MRILNDGEYDEDDNMRKSLFIYKGQLRKILTTLMTLGSCSAISAQTSLHPNDQGMNKAFHDLTTMQDFESNQNIL